MLKIIKESVKDYNKSLKEAYNASGELIDKLESELRKVEGVGKRISFEAHDKDLNLLKNPIDKSELFQLIVLVDIDIDNKYQGSDWFTQRAKTKREIYRVFTDNGFYNQDPMEDNDTYLYFVLGKRSIKESINKENQKIKDWYIKTYPTDSLGKELKDTVTFQDLFEALDNYRDVYATLFKDGGADSIVRERVFKELSKIMGVEYNYIYDQWLKGARKYEGKKSYKPKIELKEEIDYTNEDYLLTPYWYFTKHGVGPGSVPKNVAVWTSFRADGGHYFAASDVINTKDLKEFEIEEKQPNVEIIPEKSRIAIQKYLEKPISKNDELVSKRAEKLIEKELGKKPVSIKLEKVGSINTVSALLENKQTVKYILLDNDLYSI